MKITGSMNYVKFDLENGYVIKAEGEVLVGRKFVVYKGYKGEIFLLNIRKKHSTGGIS